MAKALHIDVYFDLICPWCLIGKRHLDEALARWRRQRPQAEVTVQWHSVQLLPDTPARGWDFNTFYLQRLGSLDAIRQRQAQVNAAAARAGFQIDFSGIARMPSTQQAHQLLAYASTQLAAAPFAQLLEQLFAAHFARAQDLGSRDLLLGLASSSGLDASAVAQWLDSGAGQAGAQDVPGVPFFVFNHRQALSGAQAPEVLLAAMHQATAPAPAPAPAELAL